MSDVLGTYAVICGVALLASSGSLSRKRAVQAENSIGLDSATGPFTDLAGRFVSIEELRALRGAAQELLGQFA